MVGRLRRGSCAHGMIKLAQVMEQQNSSFHQFKYAFSAGLVVQYRYTLEVCNGYFTLPSHTNDFLSWCKGVLQCLTHFAYPHNVQNRVLTLISC